MWEEEEENHYVTARPGNCNDLFSSSAISHTHALKIERGGGRKKEDFLEGGE